MIRLDLTCECASPVERDISLQPGLIVSICDTCRCLVPTLSAKQEPALRVGEGSGR